MAATYTEKDVPPGWEALYAEDYGQDLADRRLATWARIFGRWRWMMPLPEEPPVR